MSMTYEWQVTGLKKTVDGTVVQTYWLKTGTDADGNVGSFSGATPFEGDPSDEGYIAFENLTEANVLQWIQDVVVGDYETHVNQMIEKQIEDMAIQDAALPWAPVDPVDEPEVGAVEAVAGEEEAEEEVSEAE
jgi:hypothetical protein